MMNAPRTSSDSHERTERARAGLGGGAPPAIMNDAVLGLPPPVPLAPVPTISVIIVTRNVAGLIEAAIRSFLDQDLASSELIIVDGASSDGTAELIGRVLAEAAARGDMRRMAFISEPDQGIYDAMNKGVALSMGMYVYFLGADDVLAGSRVLSQMADLVATGADVVIGRIVYATSGRTFVSKIGPTTYLHNTIHHQSAFYRRTIFERFAYDIGFRLIADYGLTLHLLSRISQCAIARTDRIIATCGEGGASRVDMRTAFLETCAVRGRYFPPLVNGLLTIIYAAKFAAGQALRWVRHGLGRRSA